MPDQEAEYSIPKLVPLNGVAYGGRWTVEGERIVAGSERPAAARLPRARNVFLVLGTERRAQDGRGDPGRRAGGHRAGDQDDLYTLARIPGEKRDHVLDLSFSPGTEAYAFTFG